MPVSVVMPALEMAQETGKLVSWLKKEGEPVAKGELLLEIETDKAVMEIESPGDGVLAGVKAQEGDVIPVGQTIAWIVRPGEVPPPEESPSQRGTATAAVSAGPVLLETHTPEQPGSAEPKISPKARRLAREHGVDITSLHGSGPNGAILAEDILAAAEQSKAAPPGSSSSSEILGTIGRLMAERTTQSWTTVPHFFVTREIDAGALVAAREKLVYSIERSHGIRVTHTDLLVALVARVLEKHSRLNASWTGDGIRYNAEINPAIAMAVEEGVVGAVIHSANKKSLAEIAVERHHLAERARAGRLRPDDISGATFTISNLGMYEVDAFSAIITPPQAAVLALGRIANRVVAVGGQPVVRPMMSMTVSCDHRVADGARAALFLNDLAAALAEAESLQT